MSPLSKVMPYRVLRGRVICAYQGLQLFEVATDAGKYWVTACVGNNTTVSEMGGYSAGQDVWVSITPEMGTGFILCAASDMKIDKDAWNNYYLAKDGDKAVLIPIDLSVYPRKAGYEYAVSSVGCIRSLPLAELGNFGGHGLADMVNGEWGRISPYGPGVMVELFRSVLRGGPFSSVECYNEEEGLTRVSGQRIEEFSLHREREDGRLSSSAQSIDRKVYYPEEAVQDLPPREIEISGPAHGGTHRYTLPQPAKKEPGLGGVDEALAAMERRFGLFHEYRGIDGAYLLESAKSLTLRKTCTIRPPDEIVSTLDTSINQAVDSTAVVEAVITGPRAELSPYVDKTVPAKPVVDSKASLVGLSRVYEYIENMKWRSRGAINRLSLSWVIKDEPSKVVGTGGKDTTDVGVRSSAMWLVQPRNFEIFLDRHNGKKTYYVGTSTITMQPDGGIILEDAYHSQIIMDKGNIRISAAKDLIMESGRNTLMIAGQDAGVRVYRHCDIATNTGKLNLKAETQLNLLGGNSGAGGVLIENRSTDSQPSSEDGAGQTSGGLVLMSASTTCVLGQDVIVAASTNYAGTSEENSTGAVVIKADRTVNLKTHDSMASLGTELAFAFPGSKGAVIGGSRTILHSLAVDSICDLAADSTADAIKAVDTQGVNLSLSLSRTFPTSWLTPTSWPSHVFQFCSSEDLGLFGNSFALPETSWQRMTPVTTGPPVGVWSENVVTYSGGKSAPFPGTLAWVDEERLIKFPDNMFYDPAMGMINLSEDEHTNKNIDKETNKTNIDKACTLPETTTVTINSNYVRGSNV